MSEPTLVVDRAKTPRVPVSILIPTRNEAANLPRCLDSIAWADEVFIADADSTDGTQGIATAHGAQVMPCPRNGSWPTKINRALDSLTFRNEWVLILHAYEALPPEMEEELRATLTAPEGALVGYWINRRFVFMGRWLKHADYPNWNLRLFKHRQGRYQRMAGVATQHRESGGGESLAVQGETGRLRAEIAHVGCSSVDAFIERQNRSSSRRARLAPPSPEGGAELRRGRPPGWLRFLEIYVGQGGWRDGWEGYYFARLYCFSEFFSAAKADELRQAAGSEQPSSRQAEWPNPALFLFIPGLLLILYFALQPNRPNSRLHELPRPLARWLNSHDDLANFVTFAVLGAVTFALPPFFKSSGGFSLRVATNSPKVRFGCLVALVWSLEGLQNFIPGRVPSWEDIGTGTAGVLMAYAICGWRATRKERPISSGPKRAS